MRATLATLVTVARENPDRVVTASTWTAVTRTEGGREYGVDVYHYSTPMFTIGGDDRVYPVSPGWGSTSDRCGVGRILRSIPGGAWHYVPVPWTDDDGTTYTDYTPVTILTYRELYGS